MPKADFPAFRAWSFFPSFLPSFLSVMFGLPLLVRFSLLLALSTYIFLLSLHPRFSLVFLSFPPLLLKELKWLYILDIPPTGHCYEPDFVLSSYFRFLPLSFHVFCSFFFAIYELFYQGQQDRWLCVGLRDIWRRHRR